MAHTDPEIAKNWPTLLAQGRSKAGNPLAAFAYFFNDLHKKELTSPFAGTPFRRAAGALVHAAILDPSPVAKSAATALAGSATKVLSTDAIGFADVVGQNLGALALADLAEAAGWDLGLAGDAPLGRLMASSGEARDDARQVIWAALARGRTAGLAALLLKDPADAAPNPGAHFEGGVQPIQVHLARCLVHGGEAGAAWTVYRDAFPVNLHIERASWPELLWAARCVHVALDGGDPAGTLDWLRAEVGA